MAYGSCEQVQVRGGKYCNTMITPRLKLSILFCYVTFCVLWAGYLHPCPMSHVFNLVWYNNMFYLMIFHQVWCSHPLNMMPVASEFKLLNMLQKTKTKQKYLMLFMTTGRSQVKLKHTAGSSCCIQDWYTTPASSYCIPLTCYSAITQTVVVNPFHFTSLFFFPV